MLGNKLMELLPSMMPYNVEESVLPPDTRFTAVPPWWFYLQARESMASCWILWGNYFDNCILYKLTSTFDIQAIGEFVLTDPDMKVKPRGKIYSINEGYTNNWAEPIKQYVASKKEVRIDFKCSVMGSMFFYFFLLNSSLDLKGGTFTTKYLTP